MFSKRSFLALTVGFGLSLSACAGEHDSDTDFDVDAPEKAPMNGGNGWNGGYPKAVGPCIKGIALAAWSEPGAVDGDLNPAIHKFRCAGYIDPGSYTTVGDGPDYIHRPLDVIPPLLNAAENDVVESMVWAGVTVDETVRYTDPNNVNTVVNYKGLGFLARPWEDQKLDTTDSLSDFIAVVVAKMNAFPTPVDVYVEGDHIVRNDSRGEYTVLESVIAVNYSVLNQMPAGEILFFKGNLPTSECRDAAAYYDERTCHDQSLGSCVPGLDVLTEADLPTWCEDIDGNPAQHLTDKGLKCMGRPVFRVWVKEGALLADPTSPCVQ